VFAVLVALGEFFRLWLIQKSFVAWPAVLAAGVVQFVAFAFMGYVVGFGNQRLRTRWLKWLAFLAFVFVWLLILVLLEGWEGNMAGAQKGGFLPAVMGFVSGRGLWLDLHPAETQADSARE
jgi:hypothetical protein